MKFENVQLDFYSNFLGEGEIRLYCNNKDTEFKLNIFEKAPNSHEIIQLRQGENQIYHFSMWEGYFNQINHLLVERVSFIELPKFIRDYQIGEGWDWNLFYQKIPITELDWVLNQMEYLVKNVDKYKMNFWNFDCVENLYLFLKIVKGNNLQLYISKE
ncbi:hypothetical protein J2Y38_002562 [Flavobacterium sp. 2755]|uniref:hypothetical protein n=1 Tax=Flavobacterium sp. 2755 TaxID=2817765 RepID=UPI00286626D6|nr:hypothetical protein [Flavobacterium sp. 2755]MDR6762351.1 hypothetical protein [Flavobacterium sp. 2755]